MVSGTVQSGSSSAILSLDMRCRRDHDARHRDCRPRYGHRGLAAELGPRTYEATFRENEIDETVLPSLTHETLKETRLTAVGHRLKLLDAIAVLRSDAGGKAVSVETKTPWSASSPHPEDRAEGRQVPIMFSDLVGSRALSARMDPEDRREIITAYQQRVAETVQRFGGFVAK
jgi:SAM domain (Sterile alpha motif)